MRPYILIFLILLGISGPQAWASPKLTREECRVMVKDFERLSNLNPADVEAKAPEVLEKLRNGESLTSYFIAFNIYSENLINKGKIEKAHQEIEQMINEALRQDNAECKVIALRTQGQYYYKLGLYEQASDCFRKAMELCPRYDSEKLESCFTWSSTLFWLVQADLRTGRIEEAEHWISQTDGMMAWLEANGEPDTVGYKQVMIRGLRAKIALQRGNRDEALRQLDECLQFIQPDLPKRAYVEYYVGRMLVYVSDDRHEEALPLLDELIAMHAENYQPIAAEYLYQKGKSLARVGRYKESAECLLEYIKLEDHVNEVALAEQIEELNTRYEVEKLQHERDNIQRQLIIVLSFCVALAVIISLNIINQRKLQRKNRTLARSISELNRLAREASATAGYENDADEPSNTELLETGNSIVDYINRSKCYLRHDCSRDTIKDGTGVTERLLAKAIVAATGMSFVNYINQLRLNVSIQMLEEKPDMTISDISTACGFGTVRQFQRIFKQHFDMSPSAYREARK